jgi:hypothetical protein
MTPAPPLRFNRGLEVAKLSQSLENPSGLTRLDSISPSAPASDAGRSFSVNGGDMKTNAAMIESLESRTLMSASAFSTAVAADRLEVRADLLKFRSDAAAASAKLLVDLSAVQKDDLAVATTVAPLVKQMRTDLGTIGRSLLADRLTESAAALGDESAIVTERLHILQDKKNPTAETADHTALMDARVKLQTDLIAGLNSRIATRQAGETTIFNDISAIDTAVGADPNASAKLQQDLSALLAVRAGKMQTLTSDLVQLVKDRTQLSTDLAAEAESSN